MAKLNGVEIIGMVGGEITRVSYNGTEYERVSELEDSGRLAIGEYAVITGKGGRGIFKSHRFDIGEVVKVTEHYVKGDRVAVTNLDGDEFWWVHNEYLRKATEEEIKGAVPVFEDGDYVKALMDGEFRDILSGEIGKVLYHLEDDSDEYTVKVERIHGHKEDDYFRPQDLAKVEEDCVERVVQFAKAGRELNEFKKGDIVYAEWVNGGGDAGLYEVERGPHGYVSGGNYMLKGGVGTLGSSLTLVSPVESRVDKL